MRLMSISSLGCDRRMLSIGIEALPAGKDARIIAVLCQQLQRIIKALPAAHS